jgi:DNA-binding MarR family transcriptional regulator
MALTCVIGKINQMNKLAEEYVNLRIKQDQLPVLRSHVSLFYILPESGEKMRFQDLVDIWGVSKSSASEVVVKYEQMGLLEKCICGEDRRNVFVSLKPEAVALKRKFEKIEQDFLELILADLSEEEKEQFSEYLDRAISKGHVGK